MKKRIVGGVLLLSAAAFATVAGTGSRWIGNALEVTSYIRSVGVATGSLPSCAAASAGSIEYDTSTNTVKFCNGTAWASLASGSAFFSQNASAYLAPAVASAATLTVHRFRLDAPPFATTNSRLTFTAQTAGSGAGSITFNFGGCATTGTDCPVFASVCTLTITCNAAGSATPGTVSMSSACAWNQSDTYEIRVSTSGACTAPGGNLNFYANGLNGLL